MLFKNDWARYPMGVFKKTSTVSYKVPQMTAKLSKKRKIVEKNQLIRFWNTHNLAKNQLGVLCLLKCLLLKWHDIIQKVSNLFHQTSMRFHSAMATFEPQKYVIARTVGTENILLVSGRLVFRPTK